MRLNTGVGDLLQQSRRHLQQKKIQRPRSAIEEIDAFVMAHTTLEPEEFFRRLRQLEAWRALSASQSEGRGLCR